ncbi:MAG: S8 family serine peptidase, partial [Fibrobacter sp.]|nr:S8 family serine peptidase [Fibrobacter sp.]
IVCLLFFVSIVNAATVSSAAKKLSQTDAVCKIWVWFTDKKNVHETVTVSPKALERRKKSGYVSNETDIPVSQVYIDSIEQTGAVLKHTFKWENAASFTIQGAKIDEISRMTFVKEISTVNTCLKREKSNPLLLAKKMYDTTDGYGFLYDELKLLNVAAAHQYLTDKRRFDSPGAGVIIAFFDTGFRLNHAAFRHIEKNYQILATYDFIDNDTSVADPDSVINNPDHPYYLNDMHGTQCLGIVAGYDPPRYKGVAWGAKFVLARTENTWYNTEIHSEEDDWAAALIWAEELGVDIVSSSLGYRDGFQDSVTIQNSDGTLRTIVDYSYEDMNGSTTIVSRAAAAASQRGMIIVNSMGNEGANKIGSLVAPADVDAVVSVGALNASGSVIASFSSTGPTADGRIKPDIVAQGEFVSVPSVYNSDTSYTSVSGTSFSTPTIAGVWALILQSSGYRNAAVKNALFASCKLLPSQVMRDNTYGYGVPDVLQACMTFDSIDDSTIVVKKPGAIPECFVYPNVIKPGITRNVTLAIKNLPDSSKVKFTVLSSDGLVIWRKNISSTTDTLFRTSWDCTNSKGKKVVPGIYYAIFEYRTTLVRQKILIAG